VQLNYRDSSVTKSQICKSKESLMYGRLAQICLKIYLRSHTYVSGLDHLLHMTSCSAETDDLQDCSRHHFTIPDRFGGCRTLFPSPVNGVSPHLVLGLARSDNVHWSYSSPPHAANYRDSIMNQRPQLT
jgi:hypothetical protein